MKIGPIVLAAVALSVSHAPVQGAIPARQDCPAFRWVTLGTAGGPVPALDRSEPSNLLVAADQLILVDAGDGTVVQAAKLGIDIAQVRTLFISHLHQDHIGGVAAVIGLRWATSAPGRIVIYGPVGTKAVVDGIVASLEPSASVGYGLGEKTARPSDGVEVHEIADGDTVQLAGLEVRAAENSHFTSTAPLSDGSHSTSLSYRFNFGNRSITYTGDTGPSDAITRLASGSDLLVSEVIAVEPLVAVVRANRFVEPGQVDFIQKHFETHHLSPQSAGRIAATAKVGHLVLTHFAIPPGPLHTFDSYLRLGVRSEFSGPLSLARDLDGFDTGCR